MTKTMISARIPEKLGVEIEALAQSTKRSKAYQIGRASCRERVSPRV